MLQPTFFKDSILQITINEIVSSGIKGLLLDVDNTLTEPKSQKSIVKLENWLNELRQNGIRLMILSNAKRKRVEPFAKMLSLDFIPYACKPTFVGYLRAAKAMGLKRSEIAMVGDQMFTDIVGANFLRIKSFMVKPITLESGFSYRVKRKLENKVLAKRK